MSSTDSLHLFHSTQPSILSSPERCERAINLAATLLKEANRIQTHAEKRSLATIAQMMQDPKGKAFTIAMTDQCFRSHNPKRIVDQLIFLLDTSGIPSYLNVFEKTQLRLFTWFGKQFPSFFVSRIKSTIHKQTERVILPGEPDALKAHIQRRQKEGIRINLNYLGEAILGEEEVEDRLNLYLKTLQKPEIEYISVKISTLYSQIHLLDWKHTLELLASRLRTLYRAAASSRFTRPDGRESVKFVNLDMEEYRDLRLTVELFKSVLEEPEFFHFSAGIVLQAYLPDSFLIQQDLTEWAQKRYAAGGAPIKIRLVKGANLAMEKVEASLKNWPQAPYTQKIEVDAHYKKMMHYGFLPKHAQAAHIGIGSHNLFDIAYALLLRKEYEVEEEVSFEMLEGMAEPLRRSLQKVVGALLLYCPAAKEEEFQSAVAYLIRRLDENTGPDNFLRHLFGLTPDSEEWQREADFFREGCKRIETIPSLPYRTQDRQQPSKEADNSFNNEPDTDWSLPQNRIWGQKISDEWSLHKQEPIPIAIGNRTFFPSTPLQIGYDPSRPEKPFYHYALASEEEVHEIAARARLAQIKWGCSSLQERNQLFTQISLEMKNGRSLLMGAMLANTGKHLFEADTEVSEAIDFANYYKENMNALYEMEGITWHPKGPTLVASPWNFPCSIPAGGILAALASGNVVIFKPAPEAILVGWHLVNLFWKAGVPKDVLQFLCCADEPTGTKLIQDPNIACALLTGSTNTARHFLNQNPKLDLIAETGGKNSIIITDLADRDLAIKDLVQSAFGYAGQKCSAASLAICDAAVYDDPHFLKQLKDATKSLTTASAWNLHAKVTPLIRPPQESLLRALTTLEEGEEWLLKPTSHPDHPNLWSPGIKLGVRKGSFTHQTELFGPLLGLMRADNLDHAIELANDTPYGLTAGLHSLDKREQALWIKNIQAGNRYINRTITGAIVGRQPFGGWKESSVGPGAKAGGLNYLIQLMHPEEIELSQERAPLCPSVEKIKEVTASLEITSKEEQLIEASCFSYAYWWSKLKKPTDHHPLLGEANLFWLEPRDKMAFRVQKGTSLIHLLQVYAAACTCKTELFFSFSPDCQELHEKFSLASSKTCVEDELSFCHRIRANEIQRIRIDTDPSKQLQAVAAHYLCYLSREPITSHGRIELLHYCREVSLSLDYHRYGNVAEIN